MLINPLSRNLSRKKSSIECEGDKVKSWLWSPGLHGPEGPPGLAVDLPVGVAVVVADGDGEPAAVGPDDVEVLAVGAADVQAGVLAGVSRQTLRITLRPCQSCKNKMWQL